MMELVKVFLEEGDLWDEEKVVLEREGERARIVVVYLGRKKANLRLKYEIEVLAREARAEIRVFGVLLDEVRKDLAMRLNFGSGSEKASGEELEDSMNLSSMVQNRTKPILESAEQSASGKHGVKVGRIDEEQVNYLMARGIDERKIRKMLVLAKLKQALKWIEKKENREKLERGLRRIEEILER
mgnify:CR=1 FL=1